MAARAALASRHALTRAALAAAALLLWAATACAGALRYCDAAGTMGAAQQDRRLRFAALVKAELEASGRSVALVARSGLDLERFGQRYSHAGVSLRANRHAPWSVRQLYYACDERRPRIFDQGLAGFLLAADDPGPVFASVVLLGGAPAAALERAARDDALALALLGGTYSANAYPFSTRYQNCNQWLVELLAAAWGDIAAGADARPLAQRWLAGSHYRPTRIDIGSPWLLTAAAFVPWVHDDDHPREHLDRMTLEVSLPPAIEAFARERAAGAERIEFCDDGRRFVVRRGWVPIAAGCVPGDGDHVLTLD